MKARGQATRYLLCIGNKGVAASLEVRKIYRSISDPDAEKHGLLRVIDESGEDYLYPEKYFVPVRIPDKARRALSLAT